MKKGKKKLNNEGFSLVELIIVMAIMVILVGAISPQVSKYVEKAREAKDMQVLDTIYVATQSAIATESAEGTVGNFDITGINTASGNYTESLKTEIISFLPADMGTDAGITGKFKSKKAKTQTVKIKYEEATGSLTVFVGTDLANAALKVDNK